MGRPKRLPKFFSWNKFSKNWRWKGFSCLFVQQETICIRKELSLCSKLFTSKDVNLSSALPVDTCEKEFLSTGKYSFTCNIETSSLPKIFIVSSYYLNILNEIASRIEITKNISPRQLCVMINYLNTFVHFSTCSRSI